MKQHKSKRGAPKGNQNARLGKHPRKLIGLSGPTLDLVYEALALDGNADPSTDEIRDAVYYAVRQVYGRRIEGAAIII